MKSSPHPLRQLRRAVMLVAVTTTLAAGAGNRRRGSGQSGGALSGSGRRNPQHQPEPEGPVDHMADPD